MAAQEVDGGTVAVVKLLFAMGLGCACLSGQPKQYDCHRADAAVKIDGRLDDAAWNRAVWTDAFIDIVGEDHPRPRFRTRVKMLWDDRFLYIGAELKSRRFGLRLPSMTR